MKKIVVRLAFGDAYEGEAEFANWKDLPTTPNGYGPILQVTSGGIVVAEFAYTSVIGWWWLPAPEVAK